MQELERMISIYHAAFITFLILTVVFFIVSVILFFRFNIRGIFDMRTGRGAKKTIQKMQELNDQTGKLRQDIITNTPVSLSPSQRISAPPTEDRVIVSDDCGATEILTEIDPQPGKVDLPGAFKIEKEIMWVHTQEVL